MPPPGGEECERLNARMRYQRETALISAGLSGGLIAIGAVAGAAILAPAVKAAASGLDGGITVTMEP